MSGNSLAGLASAPDRPDKPQHVLCGLRNAGSRSEHRLRPNLVQEVVILLRDHPAAAPAGARVIDSAPMTLNETHEVILDAHRRGDGGDGSISGGLKVNW